MEAGLPLPPTTSQSKIPCVFTGYVLSVPKPDLQQQMLDLFVLEYSCYKGIWQAIIIYSSIVSLALGQNLKLAW